MREALSLKRLNAEIYGESDGSFHEQYCGAWIDAGVASGGQASYWSFQDSDARSNGVKDAARALVALPHTRMGRFREACGSAVLSGAHGVRKAAEAGLRASVGPAASRRDGQHGPARASRRRCAGGTLLRRAAQMGTYSSSRGFVATVAEEGASTRGRWPTRSSW